MNKAIEPAIIRLFDAKAAWHEAMDAYYNPNSFRRKINNCIQELRNVTFMLQANKNEIKGFEEWYTPWQDKMRASKALKWLVDSRNTIVKQQDLKTLSTLRFEVIGSYLSDEIIIFEEILDTNLTLDEIFKTIHQCNLPKDILYNSHIRLQRRWIDKNNPNIEIGELLTECWSFLARLLSDAPGMEKTETNSQLIPPCMHEKLRERDKYFKVKEDGLISSEMASISVDLDDTDLDDKIKERYKDIPFIHLDSLPETFKGQCSLFFKQAKAILKKDNYHYQLAFIHKDNKIVDMINIVNVDRSEKYISMQRLASDMESIGADALIMISEAWLRTSLDSKPDGESLNLIGVNKVGEGYIFSAQFYRHDNSEITFDPDVVRGLDGVNIIQPIIDMWNKNNV